MAAKGGLSTRRLKILHEVIESNLTGQLNIERLAREVGLSVGYLSRAFKLSKGLSPHQYILHVRVERAKHLIETSDWSLVEIAEQVGFADSSHMATVFARLTGEPPSRFRNRWEEDQIFAKFMSRTKKRIMNAKVD
ncbi:MULTISPECIES: AraC family transcriptional regulator [unclassified Bradyrhizobium]|uniref:AraC family transcriptional regulator n=1 Tax=unclassified Bradyrhizobium TaxID=2631580 RepID=UPI0030D317A6